MKTELSEYYGNGNGRTAKVLIETMGTEKKFYVDCYTKDMWNGIVEIHPSTEQAAEDFAEDFVLYNRSVLSE